MVQRKNVYKALSYIVVAIIFFILGFILGADFVIRKGLVMMERFLNITLTPDAIHYFEEYVFRSGGLVPYG